jgi:hypothetical protein
MIWHPFRMHPLIRVLTLASWYASESSVTTAIRHSYHLSPKEMWCISFEDCVLLFPKDIPQLLTPFEI